MLFYALEHNPFALLYFISCVVFCRVMFSLNFRKYQLYIGSGVCLIFATNFYDYLLILQPIKRKKEGEEKKMTQEEMLLEAAQTGFA